MDSTMMGISPIGFEFVKGHIFEVHIISIKYDQACYPWNLLSFRYNDDMYERCNNEKYYKTISIQIFGVKIIFEKIKGKWKRWLAKDKAND